jgi:ketosteroid isomerase-like protein
MKRKKDRLFDRDRRQYTASFVTSPGGAPVHARGTVLIVYKKLPDGAWKCFRGAGITG